MHVADGQFQEPVIAKSGIGIEEALNGHGVPSGKYLVVQAGPCPLFPRGQQFFPGSIQFLVKLCTGEVVFLYKNILRFFHIQDVVAVLPIATVGNGIIMGQPCRPLGNAVKFRFAPHVIFAFLPLAVGIQGRKKPAPFAHHLPREPIHGLIGHPLIKTLFCQAVGFGVEAKQLRIVVKHFFKVWGKPFAVHGIPGKAAPYLVVKPSHGHLLQGEPCHPQRVRVF